MSVAAAGPSVARLQWAPRLIDLSSHQLLSLLAPAGAASWLRSTALCWTPTRSCGVRLLLPVPMGSAVLCHAVLRGASGELEKYPTRVCSDAPLCHCLSSSPSLPSAAVGLMNFAAAAFSTVPTAGSISRAAMVNAAHGRTRECLPSGSAAAAAPSSRHGMSAEQLMRLWPLAHVCTLPPRLSLHPPAPPPRPARSPAQLCDRPDRARHHHLAHRHLHQVSASGGRPLSPPACRPLACGRSSAVHGRGAAPCACAGACPRPPHPPLTCVPASPTLPPPPAACLTT